MTGALWVHLRNAIWYYRSYMFCPPFAGGGSIFVKDLVPSWPTFVGCFPKVMAQIKKVALPIYVSVPTAQLTEGTSGAPTTAALALLVNRNTAGTRAWTIQTMQ